jgi:hypothetical protein
LTVVSAGFFPRQLTVFFFVLVGRGRAAAGTDADTAGAGLLEPAALPFVAGFDPFGFDGSTADVLSVVLAHGTTKTG